MKCGMQNSIGNSQGKKYQQFQRLYKSDVYFTEQKYCIYRVSRTIVCFVSVINIVCQFVYRINFGSLKIIYFIHLQLKATIFHLIFGMLLIWGML